MTLPAEAPERPPGNTPTRISHEDRKANWLRPFVGGGTLCRQWS